MLGFRLPFTRRKGYGMGAAGGGNEGAVPVAPSGLLTSLVSYWPLNEASGTRVDSVITSGNDLSDNNTVTQAAGVVGSAAQFTATNSEWLSRANNSSLDTGDIDFTVAFWVYLDTTANQALVNQGGFNAGTQNFLIWYVSNSLAFRVASTTSSGFTTVNGGALSATAWHFVVAWHDSVNNNINLQVDNGSVNTAAYSSGVATGRAWFIGKQEGGDYANGRIDEVGFWKRKLTATEITNLYNAGSGVTYPFTGVP